MDLRINPRLYALAAQERANPPANPRQRVWVEKLARAIEALDGPLPPSPFLGGGPPDGRIRVGILSPCAGIGGAERMISDLLDHCDPTAVRFVGAVIRADHGKPNLLGDWREHCPVAIGERYIPALANVCDVLYAWGLMDLPWGLSPSEVAGLVPPDLPLINCAQGSLEYECHNDPRAVSHAIPVAVSKAALRSVPRAKRDRARIIYNLASPDRIKPTRPAAETRNLLGIPEGVKVAGWNGRLSPEKGYWNFARGIAELPDHWVGVMAGNGMGTLDIAEFAATLPPGKLTLIGPREDIGDLLAVYDCLVMCSFTEGASLAAAEAWLAGVPLVSTRVGVLEDHPGLARIVPGLDPTGRDVADAILDDELEVEATAVRVMEAMRFAREDMGVARFDKQWTGLFREVSGPVPGPELANVGEGVWVGSRVACDDEWLSGKFDRIIHLYRADAPGSSCRHVAGLASAAQEGTGEAPGVPGIPGDPRHLIVRWSEYEPLEAMKPGVDEVLAFARVPGRLLVHCTAGSCRSPTLAMAAKVARGGSVGAAESDVKAGMLRDRNKRVGWIEETVGELASLLGGRRQDDPDGLGRPDGWTAEDPIAPPAGEYPRRGRHDSPPAATGAAIVAASVAPVVRPAAAPRSMDPGVRDRINGCEHRGNELPVSAYIREGCCAGPTRWECRAGKGRYHGQPTLDECIACKATG